MLRGFTPRSFFLTRRHAIWYNVGTVKIDDIAAFLDSVLEPWRFDDVSNNGIQISRPDGEADTVAFAVDASARSLRAAAKAGAGLLVVHHGISWGGGIKRLTGGEYEVVKAAIDSGLALYASHLPLDAHPRLGNNAGIARFLGLKDIKPAFSYHGNVIGLVGTAAKTLAVKLGKGEVDLREGMKVGVCSGGAAEFAPEAKRLGCETFVTGEASWADVIAAENAGASLVCCGHYETETFGVKALAAEVAEKLGLKTFFASREDAP